MKTKPVDADIDLAITVTKKEEVNEYALRPEGKIYYYRVPYMPKRLPQQRSARVYVVYNGEVVGYHLLHSAQLFTLERAFEKGGEPPVAQPGWYLIRTAASWVPVAPKKVKGFRGFQYCKPGQYGSGADPLPRRQAAVL